MKRYHPLLVAIHWVVGAMIVMALIAGNVLLEPLANSDPQKLDGLFAHMLVGLSIGVLLVIRLITRLVSTHPPHADTGNAMANLGAKLAHWALYLLAFGMVASGLGIALSHGLFDIVFAASGAPLPEEFVHEGPRLAHAILSKVLILFILLHIAGWAFHQFVLKDGLISRMWFGTR